jgi:hypothetical protein
MTTYRVYVRWPGQRATNKTTTDSKSVADYAWDELNSLQWDQEKPIGLAYSQNGKQVEYVDLSEQGQ